MIRTNTKTIRKYSDESNDNKKQEHKRKATNFESDNDSFTKDYDLPEELKKAEKEAKKMYGNHERDLDA